MYVAAEIRSTYQHNEHTSFKVTSPHVIRKPLRAFILYYKRKRPHISWYLRNDAALDEKLPISAAHRPCKGSTCSEPPRKIVQTSYAQKLQVVGQFSRWHYQQQNCGHSVSFSHAWSRLRNPQQTLRQASRPETRRPHLKLNRAFRVIKGHPYWCQHKSRTGWRTSFSGISSAPAGPLRMFPLEFHTEVKHIETRAMGYNPVIHRTKVNAEEDRLETSVCSSRNSSGGSRLGPGGHRPPKSCPGPPNFHGNYGT